MKTCPTKDAHEFDHVPMTDEERAKGARTVLGCSKCDVRVALTGNLSDLDREWAIGVADEIRNPPLGRK